MAANPDVLVSVEEYLHTSYEPDCDYVEGHIEERNVGEGPHSLLQVFLNRSEAHLWGFVSNGYKLRILRDNATLTRQAYVEFDLHGRLRHRKLRRAQVVERVAERVDAIAVDVRHGSGRP